MSISDRSIQPFWNNRLTELYQLACLGQLTSGLLHDLSNPVHAVSLNLQQLKENFREEKNSEEKLKRALLGIHRIQLFIESGRKYVQHKSVNIPFDPLKEIEHTVVIFQAKSQAAKVQVNVKAEGNFELIGDPIKFYQIISNLISNAIDSYEGGEETGLELSAQGEKTIEVSLKKSARTCTLSVKDWGKGIAAQNLPRIFEPFFTTKKRDQGLGIGLAITKEIVEKEFGGKIEVKSGNGQGTEFLVKLPVRND
jgi:signal transduction histidine kinase